MARITAFVICDNIETVPVPNGGVVQKLTTPLLALRPKFIPGNFSFGIFVSVQGLDITQSHGMRFQIKSPTGKVILNSDEAKLPPPPVVDALPREFSGMGLAMDIRNLTVEQEGAYSFELFVDGVSVGVREFGVFQQKTRKEVIE